MSHEIYYGKQFVKLNNKKFIPFFYQGSNNCTEFSYKGRERRVRDWCRQSYFSNGQMFPTAEDMLYSVNKLREEFIQRNNDDSEYKYSDKSFGSYAGCRLTGKHGMTFGEFKGMFTTGIKQAMTVEELREFNAPLVMYIYYYKEEEITGKGKEIKDRYLFNTTDEVEAKYKEWVDYYGAELKDRITFTLDCSDWAYEKIKKARAKARPKKEKTHKQVDSYWVLEMKEGYFIKNTRRGIRYSPYSSAGKAFIDEASVNKYHRTMKNKALVKPVKINEKITIYS